MVAQWDHSSADPKADLTADRRVYQWAGPKASLRAEPKAASKAAWLAAM